MYVFRINKSRNDVSNFIFGTEVGVKTFNNIRRRLYVVLTFAGRSVRAHALYDSS